MRCGKTQIPDEYLALADGNRTYAIYQPRRISKTWLRASTGRSPGSRSPAGRGESASIRATTMRRWQRRFTNAVAVFGATLWEYLRVNALAGASLGGALFWGRLTNPHISPLRQSCRSSQAAGLREAKSSFRSRRNTVSSIHHRQPLRGCFRLEVFIVRRLRRRCLHPKANLAFLQSTSQVFCRALSQLAARITPTESHLHTLRQAFGYVVMVRWLDSVFHT
jgi:hypothetical protein